MWVGRHLLGKPPRSDRLEKRQEGEGDGGFMSLFAVEELRSGSERSVVMVVRPLSSFKVSLYAYITIILDHTPPLKFHNAAQHPQHQIFALLHTETNAT